MNKVILIGRLTKDPEMYKGKETIVCRFDLAVNRYSNKYAKPNYIKCVAFGKLAETMEKLFSKGMKVCIEGELNTNEYTNKDDVKINSFEVTVLGFDFCESKK